MGFDTQLNYHCLMNDSTSAGLLCTGNACTLKIKADGIKYDLAQDMQVTLYLQKSKNTPTHTHTESVPEGPHWAVWSQSCIPALLWRCVIAISRCGVIWSWWKYTVLCWLRAWPRIQRITGWLRLEGTSGGLLVSNLDRPFDRAIYGRFFCQYCVP